MMLLLSGKNLYREFKQNDTFAVDDFYPIKEAYNTWKFLKQFWLAQMV